MSQDYNKIITTLNSITNDNTFLPDISNIIVIDTSNSRIGINTEDPSYSIHIEGSLNTIKTPNLIVDNTINGNIQGNVGINNTDPSFILDIDGPCKIYKFVSTVLTDSSTAVLYNSEITSYNDSNLLQKYTLMQNPNTGETHLNGVHQFWFDIFGTEQIILESSTINIQATADLNIINGDSTISTGLTTTFVTGDNRTVTVIKGIITDVS